MSASSTPKGTPVQRSPSDGIPEDIQSPQHSTPGSEAQQKKRISSLLQSPVRASTVTMRVLSSSSINLLFRAMTQCCERRRRLLLCLLTLIITEMCLLLCIVLSRGTGWVDPGADEEGGELIQPVGIETAGRFHGYTWISCSAASLAIK